MNTKGMKFLAVLALVALAFSAIIIIEQSENAEATYEVKDGVASCSTFEEVVAANKEGSVKSILLTDNITQTMAGTVFDLTKPLDLGGHTWYMTWKSGRTNAIFNVVNTTVSNGTIEQDSSITASGWPNKWCQPGTNNKATFDHVVFKTGYIGSIHNAEFTDCTFKGVAGAYTYVYLNGIKDTTNTFTYTNCIVDPAEGVDATLGISGQTLNGNKLVVNLVNSKLPGIGVSAHDYSTVTINMDDKSSVDYFNYNLFDANTNWDTKWELFTNYPSFKNQQMTVPDGQVLTVGTNQTLTISNNAKLVNNGSIVNNGLIKVEDGILINSKSITGDGGVMSEAYVTIDDVCYYSSLDTLISMINEGTIAADKTGTITVYVMNDCELTEDIKVSTDANIIVSGIKKTKVTISKDTYITVNGAITFKDLTIVKGDKYVVTNDNLLYIWDAKGVTLDGVTFSGFNDGEIQIYSEMDKGQFAYVDVDAIDSNDESIAAPQLVIAPNNKTSEVTVKLEESYVKAIHAGGATTVDAAYAITSDEMSTVDTIRLWNNNVSITTDSNLKVLKKCTINGNTMTVDGNLTIASEATLDASADKSVMDGKGTIKIASDAVVIGKANIKTNMIVDGETTEVEIATDKDTVADIVDDNGTNESYILIPEDQSSKVKEVIVQKADVTLASDGDVDLTALDVTIKAATETESKTLTLTGFKTITGTITTTNSTGSDVNTLKLSGVTGNLVISYGSVAISGDVTGGSITIDGKGEIAITNSVGKTTIVSSDTSSSDKYAVIDLTGLNIESGTVDIDQVKISTGTVTNAGTLEIGSASYPVAIEGTLTINGGTVTAFVSGNVVIGNGTNATITGASAIITIAPGATVSGTYTFGTSIYELTSVTAGDGGLTLSASGMSGNVAGGTVDMTKGKVSGLTVSGSTVTTYFKGDYTVSGRITITSTNTLNICSEATGKVTIGTTGVITVNGTLNASATVNVENNGTITISGSGSFDEKNMTITGSGTIDRGTSENVNISGIISSDVKYEANQIVTINGDTKVKAGVTMEVYGQLIIAEDVTLTIEQNAKVLVDKSTGRLTNNGKIVLDAYSDTVKGSTLEIGSNAVGINNGEIIVNGDETYVSTLKTNDKLTNKGTITINSDAVLEDDVINAKGATLTLNGTSTADIENSGAIIINGAVSGTITIVDKAATVELTKKTGTSPLTVNVAKDIAGSTLTVSETASISIAPSNAAYVISGLDMSFGYEVIDPTAVTKTYRTLVTLSGAMSVYKADGTSMPDTSAIYATLTVTSGRTVVSDYMVTDMYSAINVTGTLFISGDVVSYATPADPNYSVYGTGAIEVTGSLTLAKNLNVTTKKAATFSVKDEDTSKYTYFYTTFAAAIDSGSKTIEVFGEQTVDSNITIPTDVTVTTNGEIAIKAGSVMTVSNGAKLALKADVDVKGKLVIENKKNVTLTGAEIKSAVKTTNGDSETYSGLAAALDDAKEKSTIVLLNDVEITDDLTIPEGKALDVGDSKITVTGATLYVDGMLYLRSSTFTVQDNAAGDKGVVKVTGIIVRDNSFFSTYASAANTPAGAYYMVVYQSAPYYCMSDLETAMENKDLIEDNIGLYGENDVGTITIVSNVDVYGAFKAGTVTISDKIALTFKDDIAKVEATFKNSQGSITLKNVTVKNATAFKSSDKSVLSVTGGEIVASSEDNAVVFEGAVSLSSKIDYAKAVGEVTVTASREVTNFAIAGSVVVNNKVTLTIDTLTLIGSLTAKTKSDTDGAAGKIVLNNDAYIGAEKKTFIKSTSAAAVLDGDVTIATGKIIFVLDGATVPTELFKDAGYKSTTIMVDGKAYMTLYANGTVAVPTDLIVPVTNGTMASTKWIVDGEKVTTFNIGDADSVSVNANYKIYTVQVVGDEGIASVYIDDVLMTVNANTFTATELTAGAHTIKYLIKSGYEGTPSLALISGKDGKVSGMTVTLSGTDGLSATTGVDTVKLQLSGTHAASVDPTPTPTPTPTPEKTSDWGITEILLVVLVILIAIMVVVVILRLNRS